MLNIKKKSIIVGENCFVAHLVAVSDSSSTNMGPDCATFNRLHSFNFFTG